MLRYGIALLGLAALVGCESTMGPTANKGVSSTVLAATAGQAQYPQNVQASSDVSLVALDKRSGNTITLINPTDQPMKDLKVWVNGSFVQPLDTLPAKSMVTLKRGDFYNSTGGTLSQTNATIDRIEVQSGDKLIHVQGPVMH
ncbi:MAG TPA: hypothetical protein VHP11_05235 [Tepidisphaeraceae bacterium]|nr:hypothetical protein [Tepidisphaeraceae bacterium]